MPGEPCVRGCSWIKGVLKFIGGMLLLCGLLTATGSWLPPYGMAAQSKGGPSVGEHADWAVYGGDAADDHYSPLRQINRVNVRKLRVAWTFDTGEAGGLQTNPLVVGRVLYGFTPTQKVIALDG